MEVLIDLETNQIAGVTLYIDHSEEMINVIALVIKEHLPYTALAHMTYTHPVSSEMLSFMMNAVEPLE